MKKYFLDVAILFLMVTLFLHGIQQQEVGEYQCYALAFLHGNHNVQQIPDFCNQYFEKTVSYPAFHNLPKEYPLLTILPFTLALIPFFGLPYKIVFGLWMIGIAYGVYIILRNNVSKNAALYYAVSLLIVGVGIVAGRFDMIPAALVLIAILLAQKKKWVTAMIFLAFAGCFKFYAFLLFPVFLIALLQQKKPQIVFPVISFFTVCSVVLATSLWVNVEQTISPLVYLKNRPFQIESTWASVLWFLNHFSGTEKIVHSYGSTNIISTFSYIFYPIASYVAVTGILILYWLQIRKRLPLITMCILVILTAIITAKVFSPQYLLWVIPLIPLLKEKTKELKILWLSILLLSVVIYPYLYEWPQDIFSWHPILLMHYVIGLRNFLLVYFVFRFCRTHFIAR